MVGQGELTAETWTPPHTPLTPPGPLAYLVRAIVTPAARLAHIARWTDEDPAIATRQLVRRLQMAEGTRVAESTVQASAAKWRLRARPPHRSHSRRVGMTRRDGFTLRCQRGSFRWAHVSDFVLRPLADGTYGMVLPCDLGDHWIQPDPGRLDRLHAPSVPYGWPSAREAFTARERFERQERQQE